MRTPRARRARLLLGPSLLAILTGFVACGRSAPTPAIAPNASPDGGHVAVPRAAGRCSPWHDPSESADAGAPSGSDEGYSSSGRRTKPTKDGDLCETADSNLARAEAKILAESGGPMAAHAAWDHKSKPARFDYVARRLALTAAERDMLNKNGFVVQSRNDSSTYAWALHEVYQSELPIYISADAILHAVYTSNDHLLADIERDNLVPLLSRTLSSMHCALVDASRLYPSDVAHDLDLYLTVARSLLADAPVASVFGTDAEAATLVAKAKKASGMESVDLFGRGRLIDWSQYQPRGHYADRATEPSADGEPPVQDDVASKPSLSPYFRAGMWLSRLELNLVSRSSRSSLLGAPDPRETPREAIVALALSDLVTQAQVLDDVQKLDRAWGLLAGRREDVSVTDMIALRKKAAITGVELAAFEKLKAAIGNDFQRTARVHPMPEGSTTLPAIATFLGPRITPDTAAFRPLVHSEVGERYLVGSGDVAYVLGLDRGKAYLKDDLAAHPALASKLDVARGVLAAASAKDAGDLYGAWLNALRGVAEKPSGVVPSFMTTPTYDDLRMNTLVAGYGQIRHNYVLMAAQAYDEGGCVIPDGWVEPMPAVYDGIAKYAARGLAVMKELDPKDKTQTIAYFGELEKITRVLATIARHELEGRALSTEEKRFLSMVVEMTPGGTGGPPTYTGWYFDLFRGRWTEGLADASFVADYYTSSWKQKVVYAGALAPRMGIFVIDAGGPPRLAVGPVAHAYEVQTTLEKRLDDHAALAAPDKKEPWSASYTAPAPKIPGLAATVVFDMESGDPKSKGTRFVLRGGPVALPSVQFELLDHHRVPIATTTRAIPQNGKVVFYLKAKDPEGVRLRVGEFSAEHFIGGPESSTSFELGGVKTGESDYAEP